jgi:muconolactone delta-isomerase
MPLRVWRTDEVTPLAPHPNDPPPGLEASKEPTEFLTTFTITVPQDTSGPAVDDAEAREADRAQQLASQGYLCRLWTLPGPGRTLGLWRAQDAAQMRAIVESLPLNAWMTTEITPLAKHPSDPATTRN